jgi:hypothetical protein
MLTVTVKSTDPDVAVVADLKARLLGTTATSTANDALYAGYIRAATRWAESYVGYPLSVQSYRESIASFGSLRLRVARTPLRAVTGFFTATDTGTAGAFLTTEYRVDADPGFLTRVGDYGFEWSIQTQGDLETRPTGYEPEPWLVDYVAGWTRNGLDTGSANWSTQQGTTDTGRTLPEDVEEAVLQRASALTIQANTARSAASVGVAGVASERIDDLEVNYRSASDDRVAVSQSGALASAAPYEILLDPYRRLA